MSDHTFYKYNMDAFRNG